jgi:hypothetical protein
VRSGHAAHLAQELDKQQARGQDPIKEMREKTNTNSKTPDQKLGFLHDLLRTEMDLNGRTQQLASAGDIFSADRQAF